MRKLLALPLPILIAAGFLLLGAGVTFGAIYIGGGGAIQLQKGLVGHWKFDGNAKDSTPNENNGTVTGATLTTDRKGQNNKAYSFNGTTDYVDVDHSDSLNLGATSTAYSVSGWFKSDVGHTGVVIGKGANTNTYPYYCYVTVGGNLECYTRVVSLNPVNTWTDILGSWHHFVFVIDKVNNTSRLYGDGNLINSAVHTYTDSFVNSNPVHLGTQSSQYFLNGQIDDVRIYNRALSQAEITALYDQYDPGVRVADTQKGLVGHWRLDGNAKDSTPNANNGTLNGDAVVTASDRKGQANKAVALDGTGDYVEIEDGDQFTPTSSGFSVSAWAKINSIQSGGAPEQRRAPIAAKTTGLGGSNAEWEWTLDAKNLNNDNSWGFLTVTPTGSVLSSAQDTDNIVFGDWYHIVGVMETDGRARIYVNGTLKASGNTAVLPSNTAGKVRLGFERGAVIDWFTDGSIDDVRIYNRALSTAEITALYDQYDPGVRVADTQKGLVGHWKMEDAGDGTAKDSTPNQNIGTVTGATATTDRKAQSDRAYSFNGTTAFIGLGDVHDGTFAGADKKFSISVWIKPASTMTNSSIVVKNGDGSCTEDQRQFIFRLLTGSKPEFLWYGTLAGNSYRGTLGTTQITDTSRWYHIVAVYDGTLVADSRVALYVDGVAESTSIDFTAGTPSAIADGTAHLGIGKHLNPSGSACGSVGYFNGSIDDVRVYNRALSPTEITALYESYQ